LKKVYEHWERVLPREKPAPGLFDEFALRVTTVGAELHHVKTFAEARKVLLDLIKYTKIKKVVAVDGPLQRAAGIDEALRTMGVETYNDTVGIAAHAETADMGISGVEFGIAESGSVCADAYSVESRLVSTLPPIHVAFLSSANIVPGIEEAMYIISQVYDRGYISFITGPSRTADIERVLTIGVHGPSRLIIIAIDEQANGGAA
jgi:L-lactate dehydrogenase complex protein LldG